VTKFTGWFAVLY